MTHHPNEYDFYDSDDLIDQSTYFFMHYPHNNGARMTSTILNRQTDKNRKAAKQEAEAAQRGRQAQFCIEANTGTSDPYATLHVSNQAGSRYEDIQSVFVHLDEADLEAIQNLAFAARVKLHKARNGGLKNPSLAEYDPF